MRFFFVLLASLTFSLGANIAEAEPQRQFAQWVSDLRAKHGLGPVRVNAKLERTADRHAQDMLKHGFFSHTGSDGSKIGTRAKRAGYRFCTIGENIALGQKTAQGAMQAWIASSSHFKNMLKRGATEIGVVRTHKNHWVMVLAGPSRSC